MSEYKIKVKDTVKKKVVSYQIKAENEEKAKATIQRIVKYCEILEIKNLDQLHQEQQNEDELDISKLDALLTIKQCASLKGVSVQAIYKKLDSSKLKKYVVRNKKYIRIKKEAFINEVV